MSKIQHLRGNLYAIKGKSISLPNGQSILTANSIFIDDTMKALIDPSSDPSILREIEEENTIDWCFFSHSHLDHIYSYGLFPNSSHLIHQDDLPLVNLARGPFGLLTKIVWRIMGSQWFQPHARFRHGDIFEIGRTSIRVIHTPGHTKGHSCFYFPNERILYSADFDLSVVGPWYGQSDSSINDFLHSAEMLKAIEADLWVTGHSRWIVQDDIFGELDSFIRKIEERDSRLISCLHRSKSVEDMAKLGLITPLLILNKNTSMRESEKVMITMHMERLEARNRVQRVRRRRWKKVEAKERQLGTR